MTPDAKLDAHPHLSLAQIHAALATTTTIGTRSVVNGSANVFRVPTPAFDLRPDIA